jgi:hypothetical protein
VIPCPCCKKTVPAPTVEMVVDHLRIAPLQAHVLRAVWKGKGHPVPAEAIIAAMDQAERTTKSHDYVDFKIALYHLRKRLKPVGIAIRNTGYARGYHIEFPGKVNSDV